MLLKQTSTEEVIGNIILLPAVEVYLENNQPANIQSWYIT